MNKISSDLKIFLWKNNEFAKFFLFNILENYFVEGFFWVFFNLTFVLEYYVWYNFKLKSFLSLGKIMDYN